MVVFWDWWAQIRKWFGVRTAQEEYELGYAYGVEKMAQVYKDYGDWEDRELAIDRLFEECGWEGTEFDCGMRRGLHHTMAALDLDEQLTREKKPSGVEMGVVATDLG